GNGTTGVIIQYTTYSGGVIGYNGTSSGYNDLDLRATSGIGSGIYLNSSSGNVGIGTTSPTVRLEVGNDTTTNEAIRVISEGNASLILQADTDNSGESDNPYIKLIQDGGGIYGTIGFTTANFDSEGSAMTDAIENALLINTKTSSGTIQFGLNGTVGMTIGTTRNVGIGTKTPLERLEVNSEEAVQTTTRYTNLNTGINSGDGFIVGVETAGNGIVWSRDNNFIRFGTNATERMRILTNGNVGIGTSAPEEKLHIYAGDSGGSAYSSVNLVIEDDTSQILQFLSPSTTVSGIMFGDEDFAYSGYIRYDHTTDYMNIYTAGVSKIAISSVGVGIGLGPTVALDVSGSIEYTGTCVDVSDITLKENVTEFNNTLSRFMNLTPFSFNMINDTEIEYGLSAQEVQEYFPEVVKVTDDEGHLGIAYVSLISPMIKAMQEQQEIIEEQNNTINEMKESLCEIGIEKWCR
ncbi:tail fiber domain-containing protein, partial [Candidatus Pacearchaeota archaeon]|nr:tail fiber domain-containing protein [Candidatus Pacearchaeota archaeon]